MIMNKLNKLHMFICTCMRLIYIMINLENLNVLFFFGKIKNDFSDTAFNVLNRIFTEHTPGILVLDVYAFINSRYFVTSKVIGCI